MTKGCVYFTGICVGRFWSCRNLMHFEDMFRTLDLSSTLSVYNFVESLQVCKERLKNENLCENGLHSAELVLNFKNYYVKK